jgi:hypothetical protein
LAEFIPKGFSGSATDNTPTFEWSSVDDPSGVSYEPQYSNDP